MAKKEATHEDALENVKSSKVNKDAARTALDEFLAKNKLRKNVDHTGKLENKKLQKTYDGLKKKYGTAKTAESDAKKAEKSLRPKKERETKYKYPTDCTSGGDRKKFRAASRAAAKRAKVTLEEYLSDPAGYDKKAAAAKAEAKPAKKANAKKADKANDKPDAKADKKAKAKKAKKSKKTD